MAPDSPGSGSLSPLEIEPGSEESPSESTGGEKSWISMILMKIRNPCVSHLEWIIFDDRRKRGGCCSTKGSCGSGIIHPTSTGTRSRWTVHAAARNSDRSNESMVHGATSKMRHDEPTT
jgi:hypothetical protein